VSSPSTPEVVKWYTRARKFPQLIGRTPDGAKIWGGPYTFTQAVGAGVIALVAVNTMGLWANYGFIGNALLLTGAIYGGVLLLGRIPVGSRSPISVVVGGVHAAIAPRTGRLAGRPVRLRRPHLVRHSITVARDPLTPLPAQRVAGRSRATASPARPAAKPFVPARRRPALTGVQALLDQGSMTPTKRR